MSAMDANTSPAQTPCKWYAAGKCRFGDKCRNYHDPSVCPPVPREGSGSGSGRVGSSPNASTSTRKSRREPRGQSAGNGGTATAASASATGTNVGAGSVSSPKEPKLVAPTSVPAVKDPVTDKITFAMTVKGHTEAPQRVTSAPPTAQPNKPPIFQGYKTTQKFGADALASSSTAAGGAATVEAWDAAVKPTPEPGAPSPLAEGDATRATPATAAGPATPSEEKPVDAPAPAAVPTSKPRSAWGNGCVPAAVMSSSPAAIPGSAKARGGTSAVAAAVTATAPPPATGDGAAVAPASTPTGAAAADGADGASVTNGGGAAAGGDEGGKAPAQGSAGTRSKGSRSNTQPRNAKGELICRFFVRGICRNGDKCGYSHEAPPVCPPATGEAAAPGATGAPPATNGPATAVPPSELSPAPGLPAPGEAATEPSAPEVQPVATTAPQPAAEAAPAAAGAVGASAATKVVRGAGKRGPQGSQPPPAPQGALNFVLLSLNLMNSPLQLRIDLSPGDTARHLLDKLREQDPNVTAFLGDLNLLVVNSATGFPPLPPDRPLTELGVQEGGFLFVVPEVLPGTPGMMHGMPYPAYPGQVMMPPQQQPAGQPPAPQGQSPPGQPGQPGQPGGQQPPPPQPGMVPPQMMPYMPMPGMMPQPGMLHQPLPPNSNAAVPPAGAPPPATGMPMAPPMGPGGMPMGMMPNMAYPGAGFHHMHAHGPPYHLINIPPTVPVYCIDVECVATGKQHHDRAVAQIGCVDAASREIFNIVVKPDKEVMSYLTPLTGLTKERVDAEGVSFEEAMTKVRHMLPKESILVGLNIQKDVEWLDLKRGEDFHEIIDLAFLFRVWNPGKNSYTYFGLDHLATTWLEDPNRSGNGGHDAVKDAFSSMQLFQMYLRVQNNGPLMMEMQWRALTSPIQPSFAKQNPVFEGCCMGNRKTCTCGAPFFS